MSLNSVSCLPLTYVVLIRIKGTLLRTLPYRLVAQCRVPPCLLRPQPSHFLVVLKGTILRLILSITQVAIPAPLAGLPSKHLVSVFGSELQEQQVR